MNTVLFVNATIGFSENLFLVVVKALDHYIFCDKAELPGMLIEMT